VLVDAIHGGAARVRFVEVVQVIVNEMRKWFGGVHATSLIREEHPPEPAHPAMA
jgi:hypothetical protein